jgi:ribosomal protein L11 methyltransferase
MLKRRWLKAESWVSQGTLDVAESAFLTAQAIGLEIDDGIDPDGHKKYPPDRIKLRAYFEPGSVGQEEIKNHVAVFFKECGFSMPAIDFADCHEEDWQGNFVRSCTTFKVDPAIYIVPSFEIEAFKKAPRGDIFIEMDPENAFGTGHHQTTKLCLTGLYRLYEDRKEIMASLSGLDVGTGSGILAILMKKLGLGFVYATETDEEALVTANKNALKNGVEIFYSVVTEQYSYESGRYDIVVANILAPTLMAMAENLAACLKPQGDVILSGILVNQAPQVINAFGREGLTFRSQDTLDDWCAITFRDCR